MAIKITQPTPTTLTIQLCGVHAEAMLEVSGNVSGSSTAGKGITHHPIKIHTDDMTKPTSMHVRDIFGAVWDHKVGYTPHDTPPPDSDNPF